MFPTHRHPRVRHVLLVAALAAALPALAQFKVIGPDGRVTYTDRAPTSDQGRVTAINGKTAPAALDADLPFELRQVASRYPVVLYVAAGACEPCDSGRSLLRQRGIPFTERLVATAEDNEALEKLAGSREAPTLTIGSQVVRGMSNDLWHSYLDAAGYPRESKLPSTWAWKPATPLVERAPVARAAPQRAAEPSLPPALPPATSSTIRF